MSEAFHAAASARDRWRAGLSAAALLALAQAAGAGLFDVTVESGSRTTSLGDAVAYDLYVPRPEAGQPQPPYPALILTHGFARDKRFHANNARYMAERGICVLTPNMTRMFGGAAGQRRNIANTRDHAEWLAARSTRRSDSLHGLLDPARIALAGHSAGGAVSFEAAAAMQRRGPPVAALCLLDAVPWERTLTRADRLAPLPLACLRSEPSPCNANGAGLKLLDGLAFAAEDVLIRGGTHCDPENPTDLLCPAFCDGTSDSCRTLYQRLMYLFLQDALCLVSVENPPQTYEEAVIDGAARDLLRVTPVRAGAGVQ